MKGLVGTRGNLNIKSGALAIAALLSAMPAAAQTVTLTVAKDATVRGGSYANTNFGNEPILETRQSGDTAWVRRAVLTFDTETTVPDNVTIASATLILTVKEGNSETRQLEAFSIPISFDEPEVTWRNRRNGSLWPHAGVDVTGTASYAQVTSTPGSRVTFNVTQQVQNVINGKYGSRYARFVVRDSGPSSRGSYKQYYSREASDASVRPMLVVDWGSGSSSTPGTIGPNADGDIILPASAATTIAGKWARASMSGAIGGAAVRQPDAGAAKVATALANPANYVEFRFNAEAGKGYRVWLRGHADRDSWMNDSVHLQFSNSVTATGSAVWRMGTTSSTVIVLEDCSGCGVSGWVWQDNGYGKGVLGPMVYFASSGPQTLRIQTREDGLALDEVILSPTKYARVPPSTPVAEEDDDPPPGPSTSTTIRVLQWNVHHGGVGTDGRYDPARIAYWVAQMKPDVISFNEVENTTQASALAKAVAAATGATWNSVFSGLGNQILTRWSIENSSICVTNAAKGRKSSHVSLVVNGRQVNVWSTHLAPDSQTDRINEAKAQLACEQGWPDARVIAGDFNMQVGSTEYNLMAQGHVDGWAAAAALGTAEHYESCNGCTKNTRIDYVFSTKTSSYLTVTSARVFDTYDSKGVMPSDHKPLVVVYAVK